MKMQFAFLPSSPILQQNLLSSARTNRHQTITCKAERPVWQKSLATAAAIALVAASNFSVFAADVDIRPRLKVSGGSASTSAGRGGTRTVVKTVTRGVTLERADFSDQDFEGVSFQQSILRQADFTNCNLRNASFFDADLTGAIFVNADLSGANVSLHRQTPICIFCCHNC